MADNNRFINWLFNKTEDEIEDMLFFLLWFFTLIQAGLILWELLNLIPWAVAWLGPLANSNIHADETTTTGYLILQLAYMGKNEFVRWTKGVAGAINFKTAGNLSEEETLRRIKRSDIAILFWGLLYGVCALAHGTSLIPRLPGELTRTFVQVIGLYTCAIVSKKSKQNKDKQPKPASQARPAALDKFPTAASALTSAPMPVQETSDDVDLQKILDLVRQSGSATRADICEKLSLPRSTAKHQLGKLVQDGRLMRQGNNRSITYHLPKSN